MKIWVYLPFLITLPACIHADTGQEISGTTYCQVVEKTINLPKLQQYFHVDVYPERSPLVIIVNRFVSSCSELNKFGNSINIMSVNEAEKLPGIVHLKFVNVNISQVTAEVVFTYEPEGIKGVVSLKKEKSRWVISKSKIVEM